MKVEDHLLTIREAYDFFQISASTLYRLVKAGKIPAPKVNGAWRFDKKDLCQRNEDSPHDRRLRKDQRENDVSTISPDRRCKKKRGIKTGGSNDN